MELAAVDAHTGRVLPWSPPRRAIGLEGDRRFAIGDKRVYVFADGVRAFNLRTGRPLAWRPAAVRGHEITAVAEAGSAVIIGSLPDAGESEDGIITAVDQASGRHVFWRRRDLCCGTATAIAASGTHAVAAGSFGLQLAVARAGLAALDSQEGRPAGWKPRTNWAVYAIASSGATVYIGGAFTRVNGQVRNRLAALDLRTGALLPWNPGADGNVWGVVVRASTVYVFGDFSVLGGVRRVQVGAVDAETGLTTAWNPNRADGQGQTMTGRVSADRVYIGGAFTSMGGQPRRNLAAVDTTSGDATPWQPNVEGNAVCSVDVGPSAVYIAGDFERVGGLGRRELAAIDAATGLLGSAGQSGCGDWGVRERRAAIPSRGP